MTLDQFLIIAKFSTLSACAPIIFGLKRFSKRSRLEKYLWGLAVVALVCDVSTLYMRSLSNHLSNFYYYLEFVFLANIYNEATERAHRKVFQLSCFVFTAFTLVDAIYLQPGQLYSYSMVLTALCFLLLSIFYFFQLMRDMPTIHIQRLPMFWINSALLFYFAGTFFLFSMRHYLVTVLNDNQIMYWSFKNMLNIVKNLIFAVALWQGVRILSRA